MTWRTFKGCNGSGSVPALPEKSISKRRVPRNWATPNKATVNYFSIANMIFLVSLPIEQYSSKNIIKLDYLDDIADNGKYTLAEPKKIAAIIRFRFFRTVKIETSDKKKSDRQGGATHHCCCPLMENGKIRWDRMPGLYPGHLYQKRPLKY
jgi:hypothetical protein